MAEQQSALDFAYQAVGRIAWRLNLGWGSRSYMGLGGSYGDGAGSITVSLIEGGAANAVLQPDGTLDTMKFWSAQASLQYECFRPCTRSEPTSAATPGQ